MLKNLWVIAKKLKWGLVLLVCFLLWQRYKNRLQIVLLEGKFLEKTYEIQYWSKKGTNYQHSIDTYLASMAEAVDADKEDSVINQFNKYDCSDFYLANPFLYHIIDKSKAIYKVTNGSFDLTVAPLVKLWKTASYHASKPISNHITGLKPYVGLDFIVANPKRIKRLKEGVSLDVKGLLDGYIVDAIAALLQDYGIQHQLVKFGKQLLAYGKHNNDDGWLVKAPLFLDVDTTEWVSIEVVLRDQAMGIKDRYQGNKIKQPFLIIDPATGYPAQHTLLAVVVLAKDGISADGYGTAIMAKGIDFGKKMAAMQKDVELLMVYQDETDQIVYYTSEGLQMEQGTDRNQFKLIQQEYNKHL